MIPADKVKHLKAGLLVALVLLVMWGVERMLFPVTVLAYPWLFATMNGAVCVHAGKEVADYLDNLLSPGMHEVSVYDALAGSIGSALVVGAVLLLASFGAHAQVPNPAVTTDTLASTICKSGWTATVRPAVSYTNRIKFELMAEQGIDRNKSADYELDHVWPIEAGGHPKDPANLRLQAYSTPDGVSDARSKDAVETRVKRLICAGKQPLSAAECFRTGWKTCPTM